MKLLKSNWPSSINNAWGNSIGQCIIKSMRPFSTAFLLCIFFISFKLSANSACDLLNKKEYEKQFPNLKSYLCDSVDPKCADKNESDCYANISCFTMTGSGSGKNCSPCTPDMVFWSCENYSKEILSEAVLSYELCQKTKGRWVTQVKYQLGSCQCGDVSLFVKKIGCKSLQSFCENKGGQWNESADPKMKYQAFCSLNGKKLEFNDLIK